MLWRQLLVEHVLQRVLVELLSVQLLVFVALQFVWLQQLVVLRVLEPQPLELLFVYPLEVRAV